MPIGPIDVFDGKGDFSDPSYINDLDIRHKNGASRSLSIAGGKLVYDFNDGTTPQFSDNIAFLKLQNRTYPKYWARGYWRLKVDLELNGTTTDHNLRRIVLAFRVGIDLNQAGWFGGHEYVDTIGGAPVTLGPYPQTIDYTICNLQAEGINAGSDPTRPDNSLLFMFGSAFPVPPVGAQMLFSNMLLEYTPFPELEPLPNVVNYEFNEISPTVNSIGGEYNGATYEWEQILGPPATIINGNTLNPTLADLQDFSIYRWRVRITDGGCGTDSIFFNVTTGRVQDITNNPPTPDAGLDQDITINTVDLVGTITPGINCDITQFYWLDESNNQFGLNDLTPTIGVHTGLNLFRLVVETECGVTVEDGVTIRYTIPVIEPEDPVVCSLYIADVQVSGTVVTVTHNTPDYPNVEFRIDEGPWQDSNIFIGLDLGEHEIEVRSKSSDCSACAKFSLFGLESPRDGGDFTISYSLDTDQWVSFHDYKPNYLFNTFNDVYSLSGDKIWEHNEGDRGVYYGVAHPSILDIPFAEDFNQTFYQINWESEILDDRGIPRFDKTIDHITVRNTYQTTGRIEVEHLKNMRNVETTWNFNDLRDIGIRDRLVHSGVFKDYKVNEVATNPTNGNKGRFNSKFVIVRVEIDNKNNYTLYLQDVNVTYRLSDR